MSAFSAGTHRFATPWHRHLPIQAVLTPSASASWASFKPHRAARSSRSCRCATSLGNNWPNLTSIRTSAYLVTPDSPDPSCGSASRCCRTPGPTGGPPTSSSGCGRTSRPPRSPTRHRGGLIGGQRGGRPNGVGDTSRGRCAVASVFSRVPGPCEKRGDPVCPTRSEAGRELGQCRALDRPLQDRRNERLRRPLKRRTPVSSAS
jgi:hypothetical protein